MTLDILTVQMDAGRELLGLVMERAFTTESLFFSDGGSWAYKGTRIQYRGTMQVIDDPADFITMPIGF